MDHGDLASGLLLGIVHAMHVSPLTSFCAGRGHGVFLLAPAACLAPPSPQCSTCGRLPVQAPALLVCIPSRAQASIPDVVVTSPDPHSLLPVS